MTKKNWKSVLLSFPGGVAVIRVGAASETELTYIKHKMEDALAATRAAIAEGIVSGGGVALAKVAIELERKNLSSRPHEFQAGYEALLEALYEPLRQIAKNAGEQESAVVLNEVLEGKGENFGYDASKDEYVEDMIKEGIIDPVRVTRSALENAVSVASILLTTEAVVTDKPEENKNDAPMGGGMPGGIPGMM